MHPMSVYIHGIETAVPSTRYTQPFASELMQKTVATGDATRRMIRSIYQRSGIDQRHSVITDFQESAPDGLFFNPDGTTRPAPGTGARNQIYSREAHRLYVETARTLLDHNPQFQKQDITHVITVSCTGFFAPGPDYHVVRDLGLNVSVERYHIGFMGCYAAFQGLKMAQALCHSRPDAVVLVLCVELCTLHLQFTEDTDALIAASVFADGASGALVSARPVEPGRIALAMDQFANTLTSEGEEDMAWTIGDQGFLMKLSTYVPEIIRANIEPALLSILSGSRLTPADITHWAIHPGGRAILDKVQQALALNDSQMHPSREVLRRYGNMSSATILFVLRELLFQQDPADARAHASGELPGSGDSASSCDQAGSGNSPNTGNQPRSGDSPNPGVQPKFYNSPKTGERLFAMAFGPGLTLETGLLHVVR